MMECTIFGGVILDRYLEMETYPERGQDGLISSDFSLAGGCSINMAATFNNLGGSAHIVSCLGMDATGYEIVDYMNLHGFSGKYIKQVDGDTGYCLVILEKDGERTFMTKKGVESVFHKTLLDNDTDDIKNVMLTGYYLLSENVQNLVRCLEEISRHCDNFLFDPGPLVDQVDPEILKKVLSMANIITMNEVEAKIIGLPADASKLIVIKKGNAGGEVFFGTEHFDYHAKKVETVDTTGAGDSFAAGLMFGLTSGLDIRASIDLGIESSAKTVKVKGPHGFWKR